MDIVVEQIFILGKEVRAPWRIVVGAEDCCELCVRFELRCNKTECIRAKLHVCIRKDNHRSPCVAHAEVARSGWPYPVRGAQIVIPEGPCNPGSGVVSRAIVHHDHLELPEGRGG